MLIDWFTVAAQAVNFLILMWLLKRFLYKPVLKAIDAREQRIAETVKTAEEQKRAAEEEHALFVRKNESFERDRVQLLAQAREEAQAAGKRFLEQERHDAEASREKWRASLADEQRRFGDEIVRRVRGEVVATLRKAFADLADTTLESRMVDTLGRRLRESGQPLAGLAGTSFLVKSAFPLSEQQQGDLRKTFSDACSADVDVRFQTEPDLIGGVELVAGGKKIAWSLGDYLGKLEDGILGDLTGERSL